MTKATATPARAARLRWVPLNNIVINENTQREFSEAWARTILSDFDIDKFQFPTVSMRDGRYYMVDGQHGTWAYKEFLGDWEGQKIQCLVHEGLTEQEEAELFLSLNNKKQVDAFDRFTKGVTAQREVECDVDRIVRANGCVVTKGSTPGAIRATSALIGIYRDQGPEILGATIRSVRDAYGDAGYETVILRGLGMLLGRYSAIDRDRLVAQLRNAAGGSKGLLNLAETMRQGNGQPKASCVAAVALDIYNRGLAPRAKRRLPSWWRDLEDVAA